MDEVRTRRPARYRARDGAGRKRPRGDVGRVDWSRETSTEWNDGVDVWVGKVCRGAPGAGGETAESEGWERRGRGRGRGRGLGCRPGAGAGGTGGVGVGVGTLSRRGRGRGWTRPRARGRGGRRRTPTTPEPSRGRGPRGRDDPARGSCGRPGGEGRGREASRARGGSTGGSSPRAISATAAATTGASISRRDETRVGARSVLEECPGTRGLQHARFSTHTRERMPVREDADVKGRGGR